MKKNNTLIKNLGLLALIVTVFAACEREFSSLDSDVVNSENTTNFDIGVETFPLVSYTEETPPFQSNSLPSNLLGFYSDPVFGTSTANFVAQVSPTSYPPNFGENVVLDSVVLTIPYYSTATNTDENGYTTYRLDSIYGNETTPIKLSVFQNNYFLRSFDPNSEFNNAQKYYSNGAISESNSINSLDLESQLLYEDAAFLINENEIILTELDEEGEKVESAKVVPSIRVKLDNPGDNYWKTLLFDKDGEPELSNQNNFLEYFRGLYFKVEAVGADGPMMLLNFNNTNANVTVYYTSEADDPETDGETVETPGTFVLNFTGNLVTLFDNNFITLPTPDPANGDEKLYIKGGEGSRAIINLFNGDENGESPDLTDFKEAFKDGDKMKRLVNEAYLEFFVDQSVVNGQEPDRLMLYDIENNTPLIDYFLDQSVSDLTINAKIIHLPYLEKVDGEGFKYKIRITEHINNILVRDSTNVKLGLMITSNVGAIDPYPYLTNEEQTITSGTILSPQGTVLFGNNTTNSDKRAKLTIYYTEPENN